MTIRRCQLVQGWQHCMQQVTALAACNSSVQTALLQCFNSISKGCTFFLRQIKKNWNMPHRYGTTPSNATPLKSKLYAVKRGTFHLPWLQTYYQSHSHVTETAVGLSPAAHSRVLMLYHICNGLVAITTSIYLQPTVVVVHPRGFVTSYRQIQCDTSVYSQTFFPSAIRLWNTLPVAGRL